MAKYLATYSDTLNEIEINGFTIMTDKEIEKYKALGFNEDQMRQIRLGLQKGIDVSIYYKPEYNVLECINYVIEKIKDDIYDELIAIKTDYIHSLSTAIEPQTILLFIKKQVLNFYFTAYGGILTKLNHWRVLMCVG